MRSKVFALSGIVAALTLVLGLEAAAELSAPAGNSVHQIAGDEASPHTIPA
ncbi:hypothetical protein [Streptomyces sp. NPDC017890]|uniref:hypothetical protein n=1 Tax=Streptomyces sp. NPDC017890 TaxID=3365015 RepID=UPI0037BC6D13